MNTTTSDTEPLGSESPLPTNTVFELLRNDQRRYLLQYLSQKVGTASLTELAEQLALHEDRQTTDQFVRITTRLHHEHLPKLADVGIVSYDPVAETVELLGAASQLEPFLELTTCDLV